MPKFILPLSALIVLGGSAPGVAGAPCRNAKGQFVKCSTVKVMPTRCRDAKGQFAKCSVKGAKRA